MLRGTRRIHRTIAVIALVIAGSSLASHAEIVFFGGNFMADTNVYKIDTTAGTTSPTLIRYAEQGGRAGYGCRSR